MSRVLYVVLIYRVSYGQRFYMLLLYIVLFMGCRLKCCFIYRVIHGLSFKMLFYISCYSWAVV